MKQPEKSSCTFRQPSHQSPGCNDCSTIWKWKPKPKLFKIFPKPVEHRCASLACSHPVRSLLVQWFPPRATAYLPTITVLWRTLYHQHQKLECTRNRLCATSACSQPTPPPESWSVKHNCCFPTFPLLKSLKAALHVIGCFSPLECAICHLLLVGALGFNHMFCPFLKSK